MSEEKGKSEPSLPLASRILLKIKASPDKKVRVKMLTALAKLPHPWILPILLEALADPSEEVREKVVRGLSSWEQLPLEPLASRLKNQPWYVKTAVLQVLAAKKAVDSLPAIAATIDDPNVEVRRHAANCLGKIGGKEVVPLLVQLLKDSNPYVRQAATEAIQKASRIRFT